jgi:hypothetical protein
MRGRGRGRNPPLGQIVSSTDFMMPYGFNVELMGDRATLRDDLLFWGETELDLAALRRDCPFPDVSFHEHRTAVGSPSILIQTALPGSADVSHHPFQGEIDELVTCILERRETQLNVFDAQKTMEICLAADRSAALGGRRVKLPLIR